MLAIGVDNIFIFVHAYNRIPHKSKDTIEKNIGKAMGQVGPSILLCTCSEICCFAIGSISDMPAVNTFAIYAAVAVFMDFVFQITAFVAIMCLDQKRYQVSDNNTKGHSIPIIAQVLITLYLSSTSSISFPERPHGPVLLRAEEAQGEGGRFERERPARAIRGRHLHAVHYEEVGQGSINLLLG